jgi:peptidoglycan-N-acetylmuramic acid deacetylase
MKNKFWKLRLCVSVGLIVAALLQISVLAKSESYSWYCTHVKGHMQPPIGAELRFVEEYDGFYIDRTRTEENDKVMYLTFDAGYENGNVAKILDVLKDEQVTGAFFILGHLIDAQPDLVKRMAEEGHEVCNHTVRHRDMSCATEEEFLKELHDLECKFLELTGKEMERYYRPPEGKFSRENLIDAQKNGYKTIFWSFAYPDWDNTKQMPTEKAKRIIFDNFHNGEVMLLHPTSAVNAEILGDVIREAKSQGYRFGALRELTGQNQDAAG